jgi:Ca2+-transporting ATPase
MEAAYKETRESVFLQLNSSSNGITDQEAQERIKKNGENKISKTNQRSLGLIFLDQFKNFLVLLLLIASLLSLYLGSYRDAIVLLIIVLVNACIGFYQNWKSENILASIGHLLIENCVVIRNGNRKEIPVTQLVIGDLVQLNEGDGVPADLRLVSSVSLFTNDFILTGESLPKEKNASQAIITDTALADRNNCVFMGTTIAKGEATGLVYAIGMQTELGRIANSFMQIDQDISPLQKEMDTLAFRIMIFTLIIGVLLFVFRIWQHDTLSTALVFAIGVAAAMVPEGLPAQISIALSMGVQRLAKRNAIVKKLSSVETLGAATVIASDKTGTITKNEMTINFCRFDGHDYKITGTGFKPHGELFDIEANALNKHNLGDKKIQFLSGYLASTAKINAPDEFHSTWYAMGDPTEAAFATLACKAGYQLEEIDQAYPRIQLFPFDSLRKRISIIREHHQKRIVFVKGSIESILEVCSMISEKGKLKKLESSEKEYLLEIAKSYAANGYRILATAYKDMESIKPEYTMDETESQLVFSGFVSMMDPPHEAVKPAIQAAFDAGVRLIMITGDNEITASAIADQIGMKNTDGSLPEIINDSLLKKLSDQELETKISQTTVIFSRVSPEEKLRIVTLLKNRGDVVAVTGDGVNDTLSLKKADIGISMGMKGSKIAQEASNMVLLDDNFSTIVFAIEEGRTIYHNIKKNVKATLASNLAELTCVLFGFAGVFFNFPVIILAIHILLIDLIGEMLPLLMLSFDPSEKNQMKIPPRPQGQMISSSTLLSIIASGLIRGLLAISAFFLVYYANAGASFQHEKAVTATFVTIILTQFINILCMRSKEFILEKYLFSNASLFLGIGISSLLMMCILYIPFFNQYVHTGPLSWSDWKYPGFSALIYLTGYEIIKWVLRLKDKRTVIQV